MRIIVCTKQVIDPLTPVTELVVDRAKKKVSGPANTPPVINGYDEQALEAALRLKDSQNCEVITLAAGARFTLDVMKRALAVGADDLVLIQDAALETWDSSFIATVLAAAIKHLGADLILCGRQASDWDNAQVPLRLAEMLGAACLTFARKIEVQGQRVSVERVLSDGFQEMTGTLPAVVTVTSELGPLRYPKAKDRMQAARRQPKYLTLQYLGIEVKARPAVEVLDLGLFAQARNCEFIAGEDGADLGKHLAKVLLDARLI